MSRSKRTNFAKAKIWMENMTSEVEGPIAGVAIQLFQAIEKPEVRKLALEKIQEWHSKMLEREQEQAQAAENTSA